jgi:ubiquitin-conjugating enzyme (huntingtin interacting protein 2)
VRVVWQTSSLCLCSTYPQTALVSLQALLSTPEPDDPQDAEVAKQYKTDNATWAATARFWTDSYAVPKEAATDDLKVEQLTGMGFDRPSAVRALAAKGGDLEAAMEMLLSGI